MKILVTGAGGVVGSYLARELAREHNVVGTIHNTIPKGVEIIDKLWKIDLSMDMLPEQTFDVIIHVAALLYGNTEDLVRNNITATQRLIDYALRTKTKRFIYISTVSVYGQVEGELEESTQKKCDESYGLTKLIAENLVVESNIEEKLIIRLPRMLSEDMKLDIEHSGMCKMIKQLLDDADVVCDIPFELYNNYMHVSQLHKFVERQLYRKNWEKMCETVNLGATQNITMYEILDALKKGMDSNAKILTKAKTERTMCARVNVKKAVQMGLEVIDEVAMLERFAENLTKRR
ncbi:MAG: NAD(P)-dependent oxidoreductase [Lachnospiraceae bacterium]|nr:NAD(P)-dependent oxidoreductase [Lachnospiraceae bacterium]